MSVWTYGFESKIQSGKPVYQYPIVFIIKDPASNNGMYFQRLVKKKNMAAIPRITKPSLRANGMKLRTKVPIQNFPFKLQ